MSSRCCAHPSQSRLFHNAPFLSSHSCQCQTHASPYKRRRYQQDRSMPCYVTSSSMGVHVGVAESTKHICNLCSCSPCVLYSFLQSMLMRSGCKLQSTNRLNRGAGRAFPDKGSHLCALFLRHEPLVPGQGCAGGVQHPELSPPLLHLVASVRAQLSWKGSRCVLEQLQSIGCTC